MLKFSFFFFLIFQSTLYACDISFIVKDQKGNSVDNGLVKINKLELKTNSSGKTNSINLEEGKYTVSIYIKNKLLERKQIAIDCKQEIYYLVVDSFEKETSIEEVVLQPNSIKKKLENTPFSVQVVEMKKEHNKAGDVSNVLNRTAGIKIRTDGNLGSTAQINLGGLQGKAIRLFKDGIPIELFGHGFNLGTIPTNLLERVEVYKGAMPVNLASDALGGGINLVTRFPKKTGAEVSYEISSFNTHRATANVFIVNEDDPNLYFGVNTAYNYSDNNYKVNAPFTDFQTGKEYRKEVKRFHDQTKSFFGEFYTGFRNKKWADDFRISFIFSDFYKQVQNDAVMKAVYGRAFSSEQNYTSMVSYKKALFDNKLKINSTLNYSHFNTKLIDTARVRYDWSGNIIFNNQQIGEINKGSNQRLNYDLFSARVNASYQILPNQTLEFGELFYHQKRRGSDPLGAISPQYNIDVLEIPAIYQKNILALALRSQWFKGSLESIIAAKNYSSKTTGFTTDKYDFAWQSSQSNNLFGYLMGLKWNNDRFLLKMSYEKATRLPDESEVFGNGVLVKENLDLVPESSHNVNFNTQYAFGNKTNNGIVALNLFYRKVKDAIFLQPDIPYSRYINFHQVKILGFELEANYNLKNIIDFGFNGTYQDIRRVNETASLQMYEGSRVANIPYLFGNLFLNGNIHNVFSESDKLSLRWNSNYVHRFYLTSIPKEQEPSLFENANQVFSDLITPNDGRLGQFSHEIGIYYQFANKKVSTSFEILNLTNNKLYDNFNVQKPGRAYHFKIIYNIF